jgi:hypothetical protein
VRANFIEAWNEPATEQDIDPNAPLGEGVDEVKEGVLRGYLLHWTRAR